METMNQLSEPLEHRPFFEDHIHCESWTDQTILMIETVETSIDQEDLNAIKQLLLEAKEMLANNKVAPQSVIDNKFGGYLNVIYSTKESQESWGEIGVLYAKIYNYLHRKLAVENQD